MEKNITLGLSRNAIVLDIKPKNYRYTTTTSKSACLVFYRKPVLILYSLKKQVTTNESLKIPYLQSTEKD